MGVALKGKKITTELGSGKPLFPSRICSPAPQAACGHSSRDSLGEMERLVPRSRSPWAGSGEGAEPIVGTVTTSQREAGGNERGREEREWVRLGVGGI